jgi:hypothetical protein
MVIPTDILFESSYVLGIRIEPYTLTVIMDFVLTPEHPLYAAPKQGEQECYVKGRICIGRFEKVTWTATGFVPSCDTEGEYDHGNLDEFVYENGVWRLACDAGVIELIGGTLSVLIEPGGLDPAPRTV